MPNNPTDATELDINAITQTASVRTIKTSDAMGVASSDTAQTFGTLQSFSAGISASSVAVSGRISSTEGVTFGSGTTFMAFVPNTAANNGGLWIRNGVIQVGGAAFSSGQGSWSVNPDNEVMFFAGRQEMYVNQSYQADKNAISIAIGVSHSADAIRITKQTGTLSDAYKIAGCNANGVWYGAGISAGGATFSADIAVNGVRVGRGAGSIATNTVLGAGAGAANTSGANNIFVGSAAGDAVTTGSRNIAIGSDALGAGVTTSDCVAVGHNALLLNKGDGNVGVGNYALDALTTGTSNVAIGTNAASAINTGSNNFALGTDALKIATTCNNSVALGTQSLQSLTTGLNNIGIGTSALQNHQTTHNNLAIGTYSMFQSTTATSCVAVGNSSLGGSAVAATTSTGSVAVGANALAYLETGWYNTAIGYNALYGVTSGHYNVGIGNGAGDALTSGSRNIAIGSDALGAGVTTSDCVAVGYNALLLNRGDNNVTVGNYALDALTTGINNVAIGSNAGSALTTGSGNFAMGTNALKVATTVSNNIAIGFNALQAKSTSGDNNLAIGTSAMYRNLTSGQCVALGYQALFDATSGDSNTAIGYNAMVSSTTSSDNTAVGGFGLYATTTGNANTAVGGAALMLNTVGINNTGVGLYALYNSTGYSHYNTAIGWQAGYYTTLGATLSAATKSTFIGSNCRGYTVGSTNEIVIGAEAVGLGSNTAVIGATTQTAATIYGLVSAPGGISAAGATFSGSIRLQNAEYIQNTTNGRVDLMPGPAASTAYGMYFDMTSWTYGVKIGTIKSSDGVLNNGNFLWEAPLCINNNVAFNIGTDGQYAISRTSTGLDTTQFTVNVGTGQNSGAFALVDSFGTGNANRSPVTAHSNPNLYVYRAGSASANDFIRVEHDGTNGNIVSGGTSGILIQPGSGVLGISGGISAAGATFSGNVSVTGTISGNQGINTQTGTSYTLALTDLRKLITLNNAAAVTLTLPTFASVGFTGGASVDIVQLGAGVVGVTGAAGVTVRSTPGLYLRTQYSTASCIKIGTNEWLVTGDLSS